MMRRFSVAIDLILTFLDHPVTLQSHDRVDINQVS